MFCLFTNYRFLVFHRLTLICHPAIETQQRELNLLKHKVPVSLQHLMKMLMLQQDSQSAGSQNKNMMLHLRGNVKDRCHFTLGFICPAQSHDTVLAFFDLNSRLASALR